jgi:hypothetical protein
MINFVSEILIYSNFAVTRIIINIFFSIMTVLIKLTDLILSGILNRLKMINKNLVSEIPTVDISHIIMIIHHLRGLIITIIITVITITIVIIMSLFYNSLLNVLKFTYLLFLILTISITF